MMLRRGTAATAPREFHLQMPGRINQIGDCVCGRATRQPTGYLNGETWRATRSPKCHLWHQPGLPHGKVRNRQRKMRSNLPLCARSPAAAGRRRLAGRSAGEGYIRSPFGASRHERLVKPAVYPRRIYDRGRKASPSSPTQRRPWRRR